MQQLLATVITLSALALASNSYAIDWSGQGDAGYNQSSGNSENTSLKIGVKLVGKQQKFTHTFGVGSYVASRENETSAESYNGKYEINYDIAEYTYLLSEVTHIDNRFSGYEYQSTLVFGAGHSFFDNERRHFSVDAGAGVRRARVQLDDNAATTTEPTRAEYEEIFSVGTKYKQQLTDNTTFFFNAQLKAGDDNTYSEIEATLRVSMTKSLALNLGYLVKNNSNVPIDTEETDTLTSVSISYKF